MENKILSCAPASYVSSAWPSSFLSFPKSSDLGDGGCGEGKSSAGVQRRKPVGRWQGRHPQASKFSPGFGPLLSRLHGLEPGMISSMSSLHPACLPACLDVGASPASPPWK